MNRTVTLAAHAVLRPGETVDVSFVPPLTRRRLSPLQKIYFALAHAVAPPPGARAVFASRDGEDTLTRRLVDDFRADGTVSPYCFSSSVYNAAPGLWSIFSADRASYTAVAAAEETIDCALLEAFGTDAPVMGLVAEETSGGFGAAFVLERESARPGARPLRVTAGDPSRAPLTFDDLTAFLTGGTDVLAGRWVTVRSV